MDVPAARRSAAPTWLNLRTILGLLLFCGAALVGQRIMEASAATTLMWAADRDLAQGTILQADDLRPVEVNLPADIADRYVAASVDVEGSLVGRAVLAGELLHQAWLTQAHEAGAGRSMTIPVSPEHAVGGALRSGDRIDIYATFDPGDMRARTTLLARDVALIDVVTAGGFAIDEEALIGLTVSVSPDEAARLAFAIRTGEIDVVRITGDAPDSSKTTVRVGDFP